MQWILRFGARRVEIAENQHIFEPIFPPILIAATGWRRGGVLKRSKDDIPHGEIGEILSMVTILVVYAM